MSLLDTARDASIEALHRALANGAEASHAHFETEYGRMPLLHWFVHAYAEAAGLGDAAEAARRLAGLEALLEAGVDPDLSCGTYDVMDYDLYDVDEALVHDLLTGHTALFDAARLGAEEPARLLLEAGANPDRLLRWGLDLLELYDVTITPRLQAFKRAPALAELFEEFKPLEVEPGFVGSWLCVAARYSQPHEMGLWFAWHTFDTANSTDDGPRWSLDLELHEGGTYEGHFFFSSDYQGTWEADDMTIRFEEFAGDAGELLARFRGHVMEVHLTDEQTGLRGPADFYYVRRELLEGLPPLVVG